MAAVAAVRGLDERRGRFLEGAARMTERVRERATSGVYLPAWAVAIIVGQGISLLTLLGGALWWARGVSSAIESLPARVGVEMQYAKDEQARVERELREKVSRLDAEVGELRADQKTMNEKMTRVLVELAGAQAKGAIQ